MSDVPDIWNFENSTGTVFGSGSRERIEEAINGRRTLIVTTSGTKNRGVLGRLIENIDSNVIRVFSEVTSRYSMDDIDRDADDLQSNECECILAIGGGSVIDAAKCFSVLLRPGNEKFSLSDHFLNGTPIPDATTLPVIAVPTTAGSGSEVTPFATVWDFDGDKKYSLASEFIRPEVAIVDPSLTITLPPRITVSSGLDAVSHAFESIWNRNASPATTALATRSLKLSIKALPAVLAHPDDSEARSVMSEASLLAGLAIGSTRTALAHSMSYPMTSTLELEHGLACSYTLPAILRFNAQSDDGRLVALAHDLGSAGLDELGTKLTELFSEIEINKYLSPFDLSARNLSSLAHLMIDPSRASNNLRKPDANSIISILEDSEGFITGLATRT